MIRIKFSDIDWTDVDGKIIKMSVEKDFITNSRLTHNYQPPVITEDTWAGETFPVQINIWESYLIELYVKELAINMMNKMIVCRNVTIQDFQTGEIITLDTKTSGAISLEPGERFGTSGLSFNLICRSRKIKLYPERVDNVESNTNTLLITDQFGQLNFYTNRKIVNFVSDPEISDYQRSRTGQNIATRTLSKNGVRMVFYLMETNAIILKRKIENIGATSIVINPNTDNLTVTEIGKVTPTQLPEGLYKCECELILTPNLAYA